MWMILQDPSWWCPMCGWHGDNMMGMWLFWLILILAIGAVAVALLRRGTDRPPPPAGPAETPAETLRRRYAAGEIDRDTYRQMLADLGETPP